MPLTTIYSTRTPIVDLWEALRGSSEEAANIASGAAPACAGQLQLPVNRCLLQVTGLKWLCHLACFSSRRSDFEAMQVPLHDKTCHFRRWLTWKASANHKT